MTRFGVMKHLRILAAASLVTTRRDGRRKLHFLQPVPIQLIADRWISRYAQPWTAAMADLKSALEAPSMAAPRHVYETYIRTSPERLWQALTDPDLTQRYYYGTRVASGWQTGDPITYTWTDGTVTIEVRSSRRTRRGAWSTFHFTQDPEQAAERPSRCTWEIVPMGEACLLRLTHDDFDGETSTYRSVGNGWSLILSGVKSLLETGSPPHPGAGRGDGRPQRLTDKGGLDAHGCTTARLPGLHQGHARAPLAGDHGPGHDADLLLQLSSSRTSQPARRSPTSSRMGAWTSRARSWRPIRRASWSTRSPASGRRTTIRPAPSPGRSRPWAARRACYR